MANAVAQADPFAEIADEWSRPWKIGRVLRKLGMDVPDRLHRSRVAALVAQLHEKQIEVRLADGSRLENSPPCIDAQLRLRRARHVPKEDGLLQVGSSNAGMSLGLMACDENALRAPCNPKPPGRKREAQSDPGNSAGDPDIALSIRQPWAELIMRGVKTIEYRSLPLRKRGRVHVYASLGRADEEDEKRVGLEHAIDVDALPRGVLVGTIELMDCEQSDDDSFEWHLGHPVRAATLRAPKNRPQPRFFRPF
jgi:hypothetical protein